MRRAALLLTVLALTVGIATPLLGQAVSEVPPSLDERLAAASMELSQTQAEAARVTAESEALATASTRSEQALRGHVRALHRLSRAGALPLAGGFPALLSHLGRVERLERLVRREASAVRDGRERERALIAESARLGTATEAAQERIASLTAEQSAASAQMLGALLAGGSTFEGVTVAESWDSGGSFRVHGAPAPSETFEAKRGSLALPLASPRSVRVARREDGEGLELEGARGARVLAAEAGRIAFRDRHPRYGLMVIVDHGDGFFSVYGGLSRADAAVGDTLARGAGLGAVEGEPLFFEVRRGTRSLDARAWLGL